MAVYTNISHEQLAEFLNDYTIGTLISYKGIAEGVENSNFLLKTNQASYILTLYEKRVALDDLPFFLGLMQYMAVRGINCPMPIQRNDKTMLGTLAGRPAALFTFLDGMCIHQPKRNHCHALGMALARLHEAGIGYKRHRDNSLSVDSWRKLFAKSRANCGKIMVDLESLVLRELDFLEPRWPRNLPSGIIHADLFPDNVFFLNGQLSGLIDFYFACNDLFSYDIVICLNAWCFEVDGSFSVTRAQALLTGYQSQRTITMDECAALPVLARGASLRFLLTRLHDWIHVPEGALVRPLDPNEYILKLKFHQKVTQSTAYGLNL